MDKNNIVVRIWHKVAGLLGRSPQDIPQIQPHEVTAAMVEAALKKRAAGHPEPLDPEHSIVDFLKVIDEPSDLEARHELAHLFGMEGYTGSDIDNDLLLADLLDEMRDQRNYQRLVSG